MIGLNWFSNWCRGSLARLPRALKRHLICISLKPYLRGVQKHQYQFQNRCQEYPNYVLLIVRMLEFPTKISILNEKKLLLKFYIPRSSMALLPRVEAEIKENMPFIGLHGLLSSSCPTPYPF